MFCLVIELKMEKLFIFHIRNNQPDTTPEINHSLISKRDLFQAILKQRGPYQPVKNLKTATYLYSIYLQSI